MHELKDGDYMLIDGAAWIKAKQFSIRIRTTINGIIVVVYGENKIKHLACAAALDTDIKKDRALA